MKRTRCPASLTEEHLDERETPPPSPGRRRCHLLPRGKHRLLVRVPVGVILRLFLIFLYKFVFFLLIDDFSSQSTVSADQITLIGFIDIINDLTVWTLFTWCPVLPV